MVTLTINGVEVTVERGTTILEAAQKAGINIPTLCHDKRLIPYGSCRMCMVEVTARGRTRKMPACFNPARDGMEVATHTDALIQGRKMQLMLLLRSHPLLCPSCDAGGDCRLQDLVYEHEIAELPFQKESRVFHLENDSHFIRHNMNLCIKCGMCVRVCDEVQGEKEISFVNRGINTEVSTDFERPLDCEFCGQCVQICPVGAIASKWLVGTGRMRELVSTDTTCSFCSLGCTLTLSRKNDKIVFSQSPAESHNDGSLCSKGRYGWPFVYSQERLTKPLIRKDGELREAEWDEALSLVAQKFMEIKTASGPNSLAALGSERLTNEEAYVFNRFVRTCLETANLDHAGGFGYEALVDGLAPILGFPASTNSITEMKKADVLVMLGADLTETHPVAKNEAIVATSHRKSKVIVIDSVKTKLAERPGMLLQCKPGTEHLVAFAMLKEIVDKELFDKEALDRKADGFDEFAASLAAYDADAIAAEIGVEASAIKEAAKAYAEVPAAVIAIADGLYKPGQTKNLAHAAASLALVTGRLGKPSCGVFVFGEKANAQGAVDMGLGPDMLPGFKKLTDEQARSAFEEAWGSSIPSEPGLSARQILEKAEAGEVRGLFVVGENPIGTYPDRNQVDNALGKLEFLVVQDMFLSETAGMADVVLPVKSFAEKAGTLTSAERRVQLLRPAVDFQTQAKTDLEIFTDLAGRMGKPELAYSGPKEVMDEIAGLVDVYKGVTYDRLGDLGLQWPVADDEDPGVAILYEGGFPGGKAHLLPAPPVAQSPSSDGYDMHLIPGALKFHSGSMSLMSPSMMEVCPEGFAELSRADFKKLGLQAGDMVRITSPAGLSITAKAKASRRPAAGTVVVPHHFRTTKLNTLLTWEQPTVNVKVEKL